MLLRAPVPGRAWPVEGSTNDTWPVGEPTAIVAPSALIAAADGVVSVGVIATKLKRRTGLAPNALTLCASTTSRRAPASVSLTASTTPGSIRVVDSRCPLGSDQRAR